MAVPSRCTALRGVPGHFLQSVALVVTLTLTILTGTLFGPQGGRQAHAFLPAAVVVAPWVTRMVVVPLGRAVCLTTCRGALTTAGAAAISGAQAGCMFVTESCELPFQQNPDVPVNDDQPPSSVPQGMYLAPGVLLKCFEPTSGCDGVNYFFGVFGRRDGTAAASGWSYIIKQRDRATQDNGSYGGTTSDVTVTGAGPASAYGPVTGLRALSSSGAVMVSWGTMRAASDPEGASGESPDPDRSVQPFRKCKHTDGSVSATAGAVLTYKESQAARTLTLPACPSGTSSAGGGAAAGSPWTPGQQVPAGTGTGTPVVPEWSSPTPEQLPHMPKPGEPTAPRRTPPGTPAEPLPEYDPITGAPTGNPMPTPDPYVPEPTPERPNPEPEGPCMWGGYAIAPADCDGAPEPAPRPTAPPTTGPSTPPRLEPDPNPTPSGAPPSDVPGTSGENPDSEGCLRESWSWNPVSWVLAPVKCALRWAFVPGPTTAAKVTGIRTDLAGSVPFTWAGDVTGFMGGVFGTGGEGGCFVFDVDLASLGSHDVIDSCSNGPVESAVRSQRTLLGIAVWVAFLAPLGWWFWRSFMPLARPHG